MFSTRHLAPSLLATGVLLTGGCGGSTDEPESAPTVTVTASPSPEGSSPPTAASPTAAAELTTAGQYAKSIRRQVGSATKVSVLTEDTDPNNLLGRPGGYVSAAVITDKGGDTTDPQPGVAYGATVEMFDTAAEAKRRSEYIQGLLRDSPVLGTEYNYSAGPVLLRVTGTLPPSVAKQYKAAFDTAS